MYELLQVIIRVILSYIIVYITFRVMGKRELGELSIIDLVVFLMIAEIIALAIENLDRPFFYSVVTILILVLLQKGLSYLTLKNAKLRDKLEGTPSVIIANGQINYQEMKKQNYSFDDLINQLRDRSVRSISEVDFAILEVDGTLSVFKKGESKISPLPLIISGNIIKENFQYVDITEEEVMRLLKEKGYNDIKEILYANYENDELFIVRMVK
ncbi:MAG: DUF421 domain-containing protein [Bacilli bacterium]|nr:DUF421 domain-containing protein [Bacilli bacterium]